MSFKAQARRNGKADPARKLPLQARHESGSSVYETDPVGIVQRAQLNRSSLTALDAWRLQGTIGNQAVGRLLAQPPRNAEPADLRPVAQKKPAEDALGPPLQQQGDLQEEVLLQGKLKSEKRQPTDEGEEVMQGNFTTGVTPAEPQGDVSGAPNRTGLPGRLRAALEALSGMDLSGVRVHTNSSQPARFSALAYTQGQDIHVGPGQEQHLPHEGWHAVQQMQGRVKPTRLAKDATINDDAGLEREADVMGTEASQMTDVLTERRRGNSQAHQSSTNLVQLRPLADPERTAAIAHAKANYDEMSVRIIQNVAGLTAADIDGIFGRNTAQALSDFQTANGIAADDGRSLQDTLDVMISNRFAAGRRNEAIHLVTDFFDLDITTDTLSVFSQPGATRANPAPPPATFPADTDFESGGLRVVRVGTGAFTNAASLRDTIQRELDRVAPVLMGPAAPHGALLNNVQVRDAISYTNRHYQDRRSIMALQGQHQGLPINGVVDADLVQHIADVQDATAALAPADGKVGRNTLEHFFVQLRDGGSNNAAMRLVMDFYDMPDYDNLLTVYFDPTVGAGTSRNPRGPVRTRFGDALFLPFDAMVHTFRHELEHVSQHKEGILSADTREFLSEANEIISEGMGHETLFTVAAGGFVTGFQHDLNRMITRWGQMPPADQRTYWPTFIRARAVIRARIGRTYQPTRAADRAEWAAATPAQQAALTALLGLVNAAVRPR